MKRILLGLVFVGALLSFSVPAHAMCIPYWSSVFKECDPSNGEPPSWCGDNTPIGFARGMIHTEDKVGAVIALAKAGFKSPNYK